MVKNPPANAGDINDVGLIPEFRQSLGGSHGNPLQYSCLENPMDRGAWWPTVHGITKSQTQLKWLSTQTLFAISSVSSVYLSLLIFLPIILILACGSSSSAFCIMFSACNLNKQGDNIQPCYTPLPILNQSVFPCKVLTVASWPTFKFFRRQVSWPGILISLRIYHSLLWSTQSKALV